MNEQKGHKKYYLVICDVAFYFLEMNAFFGFPSPSNSSSLNLGFSVIPLFLNFSKCFQRPEVKRYM